MKTRRWIFLILTIAMLLARAEAQRLSALAPLPAWSDLDMYQETMTAEEFSRLLEEVYAPGGSSKGLIEVESTQAIIRTSLEPRRTWVLRFAKDRLSARPTPRPWRIVGELPVGPEDQPLKGLKIAVDPGHLGGEWARLEERWFQIGDSRPVAEGDLTLQVAKKLESALAAMGAEVFLVRHNARPATPLRPQNLREAARSELALQGVTHTRESYTSPEDPERAHTVQYESERLFYRVSEIRHRAELVNFQFQPDFIVCIHFNAEAWGDPKKPAFAPRNHLHALVNGNYSAVELRNEDVRFEMLLKLLSRAFPEELAITETVAAALSRATGLPAYEYPGQNALRVGQTPYVWARNLLANRLYRAPVIFLEPYVMNSHEVWERVQLGDYEGERKLAGTSRKSLVEEYAQAVVEGLQDYCKASRHPDQQSNSLPVPRSQPQAVVPK
jgi:N-acetylmuramoyl-L-alanine amidase